MAFEEALPERAGGPAHSLWSALAAWGVRIRAGAAQAAAEDTEGARLQRELTATREYLQAAIEGHEAVKEELKSAHEELLSANEELQSTNEELQTAKEELESTNEELITTNEELTNRNREMASLNEALRASSDYAEAIVQTSPSPLLVLDASLHVMKANDAFYQSFKTRAEDTEGRYLYELGDKDWDIAGLREVLEKGPPRRRALPQLRGEACVQGARREDPSPGRAAPARRQESSRDGAAQHRGRHRAQARRGGACARPTAARTSSSRCWRTSCATRWPRSATPLQIMRPSTPATRRCARRATMIERQVGTWRGWSTTCSTSRGSRAARSSFATSASTSPTVVGSAVEIGQPADRGAASMS